MIYVCLFIYVIVLSMLSFLFYKIIVTNKIKILSETSVTYKQLPYIKTIYPRMTTLNNKGKPAIEFQILRLCK